MKNHVFLLGLLLSGFLMSMSSCHTIHSVQSDNLRIQNIVTSCRLGNLIDFTQILFQKDPACEKALHAKIQGQTDLIGSPYVCNEESIQDPSSLLLHCRKFPPAFSIYRSSPKKPDIKALTAACQIDHVTDIAYSHFLSFQKTFACQQALESAFSQQWPGLFAGGCTRGGEVDTLWISCEQVPEEFSYFTTSSAQLDAWVEKFPSICQLQTPITKKSLFFEASSKCKSAIEEILKISQSVFVGFNRFGCALQESKGEQLQIFCPHLLSKELVQLLTGRELEQSLQETRADVTQVCKRVGSLAADNIQFLPTAECQIALRYALDEYPDFEKNQCTLQNRHGVLQLFCGAKEGLPSVLLSFASKFSTEEAYFLGMTQLCRSIKKGLQKDRISFEKTDACFYTLKDMLWNQWDLLSKSNCEMMNVQQKAEASKDLESITLLCRNGIPLKIQSAYGNHP